MLGSYETLDAAGLVNRQTNTIASTDILELSCGRMSATDGTGIVRYQVETHRELACALQTLDFIHSGQRAPQKRLEPFLCDHLFGGTEHQHGVGHHVVVGLQRQPCEYPVPVSTIVSHTHVDIDDVLAIKLYR